MQKLFTFLVMLLFAITLAVPAIAAVSGASLSIEEPATAQVAEPMQITPSIADLDVSENKVSALTDNLTGEPIASIGGALTDQTIVKL